MIPLLKPLLPTADALLPYLREIDATRRYSNYGPLERRLQERLEHRFGAPVALLSSGTAALVAALAAVRRDDRRVCLCPAWTFVASAAAICAAGMTPHFIDVSDKTWMPPIGSDLDDWVMNRREFLGAVMVVGPFGIPVDTEHWDEYSRYWGVPVVIDGAACFDSLVVGKSPTMVSLHATKALGAGEGGFVVSTDEALIARIRAIANFGTSPDGSGEPQVLGFNGKMSEYHAAVGLAALDGWKERRKALEHIRNRYALSLAPERLVPGYAAFISAYCTALVMDPEAVKARMAERGVETRRWWGDGVAAQEAYRSFPHDELPVTAELARHCLSLPFSPDLTDQDIDFVLAGL